jgi:hypothetical protein
VIEGRVTIDGVPLIHIEVAGRVWPATLDTGFNGAVELPSALRDFLPCSYAGEVVSELAAGQRVREDNFWIDLPFDGDVHHVMATFAPTDEVLIGTRLLLRHRLEIDFPGRTVRLCRAD